ncbi:acetyl/propionyl/methylcrotonyl-CoA carboxylase subunit alpha [Hamadaea tsunoensis]|uniref:acetyl/propionyl/methylcrotonyl-CoA carboxylase subunit alpha n=1 Tax=Hamadaea tsunoensis TaxID=53368 RepID=UPI0003FDF65A|nr:biotin carboxylase N-terminal domain-containing protein [Hamadaea tsunoensis]
MFSSILVANRGEIARRVFHTCRALGITTVAVYSDPDAHALHAAEADLGVRLPGRSAAETYLRADLIIEAALAAGAEAVHPGYGFLSENAEFAQAVLDAGLGWIGPSPAAMSAMGSKVRSKELMAGAGVPVLGVVESPGEADLPLLIKASAGGGGRGMRVVERLADLPEQLAAARAEALAAFGDETVFCEPYLPTGRHVEVQVLADRHGTVWTVGERDCSVQRRHQKVIEETPAPTVGEPLRQRLYAAARQAAQAIGYEGAGTVEFLVGPDGRFFFLEMNTRLQVEHPVTEAVTGLDLVRLQLEIARGDRLPPSPPDPRGHAVEARLYAEDPAHDYRPHTGVLQAFDIPGIVSRFESGGAPRGLRLDSGVTAGDEIGVHYDPMLAKVVAWAPTRDEAVSALAGALSRARIHGVVTNLDQLVRVLRDPVFRSGGADTGFLATFPSAPADPDCVRLSAVAAALADAVGSRRTAVLGGLPNGWRNLPSMPRRRSFTTDDSTVDVHYRFSRDGVAVVDGPVVGTVSADRVELFRDRVRHAFAVARYDDATYVDSALGSVRLVPVDRFPKSGPAGPGGSLVAPMPGTVVRVAVAVGDTVAAGQPLLWLEAMKMQHQLPAPAAGVIAELRAKAGDQVEPGTVLVVLEQVGLEQVVLEQVADEHVVREREQETA